MKFKMELTEIYEQLEQLDKEDLTSVIGFCEVQRERITDK